MVYVVAQDGACFAQVDCNCESALNSRRIQDHTCLIRVLLTQANHAARKASNISRRSEGLQKLPLRVGYLLHCSSQPLSLVSSPDSIQV